MKINWSRLLLLEYRRKAQTHLLPIIQNVFSHKIRFAAAIYLFSSTHIYGIIS